jgi:CDP-paratose 2-epimerase
MKCMVTGGCGFVGGNLVAAAIKRGHEVVVIDNLSRLGAAENLKWLQETGSFKFLHCDVRNFNKISDSIRAFKPDVVFHLAGQVAMTTSVADPRMDFEVNALGTLNILESVRLHSAEAGVIYSSTNKVYGDLEQFRYRETETRYECIDRPSGFDETTPLDFRSPYGCSKGAADQYVLDYSRVFGLKTVVFRHSSMFGGRQFATYDQGWVGWFCQKALETKNGALDEPFSISGNGKQVRDVLYVDDIVDLFFRAAHNLASIEGQAFNIGGGIRNSLSLLELFAMLEIVLGVNLNYSSLPPRQSDQRVFVADTTKIHRLLGWQPGVSIDEGLNRMLDWMARGVR